MKTIRLFAVTIETDGGAWLSLARDKRGNLALFDNRVEADHFADNYVCELGQRVRVKAAELNME